MEHKRRNAQQQKPKPNKQKGMTGEQVKSRLEFYRKQMEAEQKGEPMPEMEKPAPKNAFGKWLEFYRKQMEGEQVTHTQPTLQNNANPIANILQVLEQILANNLHPDLLQTLKAFCGNFEQYMLNPKAMTGTQPLALKQYLYEQETSIGSQGAHYDPRQSTEFELLKDYLAQVARAHPHISFIQRIVGLRSYVVNYQNRFKKPETEQQIRGYRQVYVGKTSGKVLRIGYDPKATQHELYLIDETSQKVVDQHQYADQNQEMIASLYQGQFVHVNLIFGELRSWNEGRMQGIATPASEIKNYNDMPFSIELAVSVLTPVGVMNSAYMLSTGKDLFHPEKKKLSNWEKAFAVADLVLVLPLGKILKVPGKIAAKIGRSSDEAATLLATGTKAGDDFVVTIAEGSKYAERFIAAEARLAAKQAQKAAAIKKADEAYQGYKDIQKAKHARKVARGMDGVLYIKFYPSIDPALAYQAVKLFFAETQSKTLQFAAWVAKLRQQKAMANFVENASRGEMHDLYRIMYNLKNDAYDEIVEALKKNDLKKVEELITSHNVKKSFGSVALGFTKLDYTLSSTDDLVLMALEHRKSLGKSGKKAKNTGSNSNIAIFEYYDLNDVKTYAKEIAQDGKHAEVIINEKLKLAKIPPGNVKRIYSELDPCNRCVPKIKGYIENGAKGFYSFEYNDAGTAIWKGKIKKLYDYLYKPKK